MIGAQYIECVVEMSKYKSKFFILAYDMFAEKFHVIELFYHQASKLIRACDGALEKIMKLLDFKRGKLYMKHYDILINYERFMPEKAASIASIKQELKGTKSVRKSLNLNMTKGNLN